MLKWLKKNLTLKNVGKVVGAVTGGQQQQYPTTYVPFTPGAPANPYGAPAAAAATQSQTMWIAVAIGVLVLAFLVFRR